MYSLQGLTEQSMLYGPGHMTNMATTPTFKNLLFQKQMTYSLKLGM